MTDVQDLLSSFAKWAIIPYCKNRRGQAQDKHAAGGHQGEGPVTGQDDDVDGRGVVGHTDPVGLGPVLPAVEVDDGGEGARHYAENGERRAMVEPSDGGKMRKLHFWSKWLCYAVKQTMVQRRIFYVWTRTIFSSLPAQSGWGQHSNAEGGDHQEGHLNKHGQSTVEWHRDKKICTGRYRYFSKTGFFHQQCFVNGTKNRIRQKNFPNSDSNLSETSKNPTTLKIFVRYIKKSV